MPSKRENIDLYGGQARVHRQAKEQLEEELGYEPTNPRVYDHLLEHYDGPLDIP